MVKENFHLIRFHHLAMSLFMFIPFGIILQYYFFNSVREVFYAYGMLLNLFLIMTLYNIFNELIITNVIYKNIKHFLKDFNIVLGIYFFIYGTFTTLFFLLSSSEIISNIFSALWLLLTIFAFQISIFYLITYLIGEKYSKKNIINTFFYTYCTFSILFGWTSANIAVKILEIPEIIHLITVNFGTLIIFYIYIRIIIKKFKLN